MTQIIHSNGKMLFAWRKNCLSKFLWCATTFSYFLHQGKVLCFGRVGKSLARCLLSEAAFRRPCRKNYISGYIWHRSLIQTVKCSLLDEKIVYQSFYGALPHLVIFYFKEKFFVLHAPACRLRDVYCLKRSEDHVEKIISPVYLTQIVEI